MKTFVDWRCVTNVIAISRVSETSQSESSNPSLEAKAATISPNSLRFFGDLCIRALERCATVRELAFAVSPAVLWVADSRCDQLIGIVVVG